MTNCRHIHRCDVTNSSRFTGLFVSGVFAFVIVLVRHSEASRLAAGVVAICPDRCSCTVAESTSEINGGNAATRRRTRHDGELQVTTKARHDGAENTGNSTSNVEKFRQTVQSTNQSLDGADDVVIMMTKINCRNRQIVDVVDILKETPQRNAVSLDISSNLIITITRGVFIGFSSLLTLNVSRNRIELLDLDSFEGLYQLRILDLTNNLMETIRHQNFNGLTSLRILQLSGNPIKTLPEGAFDVLPSLVQLELPSNQLWCDCRLRWIVKWIQTSSVSVDNKTVCSAPNEMRGSPVNQLTPSDLHCDSPIELALFEIFPSSTQVVFDGDELTFSCRVRLLNRDPSSSMTSYRFTSVTWYFDGVALSAAEAVSRRVSVSMTSSASSSSSIGDVDVAPSSFPRRPNNDNQPILTSLAVVRRLTANDAGTWTCLVETPLGRASKSVVLSVIDRPSPIDGSTVGHVVLSCPPTVVETDRGTYAWPRTIAGVVRRLPCAVAGSPSIGVAFGTGRYDETGSRSNESSSTASYRCVSPGRWIGLDVGRCQFAVEYTRILNDVTSAILRNESSVSTLTMRFKALVGVGRKVSLPADIVIIATAIEYISGLVKDSDDRLADVVLSASSAIMNVDQSLLRAAESTDHACSRIVSAIEMMSKQLVGESSKEVVVKSAENLVVHVQRLDVDRFDGLTCYASQQLANDINTPGGNKQYRSISCVESSNQCKQQQQQPMQIVDASIVIPATFVRDPRCSTPGCSHVTLILVSYINAHLFPVQDDTGRHVTTSVISTSIGGIGPERNASDVVVKMKRKRTGRENSLANTPVYWDSTAERRHGNWLSDGCTVRHHDDAYTTFSCSHLTRVAILQSTEVPVSIIDEWLRGMTARSPFIYAGSAVLISCLVISMCMSIVNKGCQSERRRRHLVINAECATSALCLLYSFGIPTGTPPVASWIIGCGIQYFLMSCLLWFTMTLLHERRLFTSYYPSYPNHPSVANALNVDNGCSSDPRRLPGSSIIVCYTTGWIVPLAMVSAGGIIQSNTTSTFELWFSTVHLASLVFYIPAGLITVFDAVTCIQLGCLLSSVSILRLAHLPPSATVDDSQRPSGSRVLLSSTSDRRHLYTSGVETFCINCRIPVVIVISTAFVLGLSTWASAVFAASTTIDYNGVSESSYRKLFSVIYAICSSALGLVLLIVTLCVRNVDVRCRFSSWFHRSTICAGRRIDLAVNVEQRQSIANADEAQSIEQRRIEFDLCFDEFPHCRLLAAGKRTNRESSCVGGVGRIRRHSSTASHHCTDRADCIKSRQENMSGRDVGNNEARDLNDTSSSQSISRMDKCDCSTSRKPAPRKTTNGKINHEQSSLPLLDFHPSTMASSPTQRAIIRTKPNISYDSVSDYQFSLVELHSLGGSTSRTVSRHSNRLLDFDDESIFFADDDDNDLNEMIDPSKNDEQLVTMTTSFSRPDVHCSLRDDGDLISRTSGRIFPTSVPPPPSVCTDYSADAPDSSSSAYSPTKSQRRCQPKTTSSRRSRTPGRSRPKLRCPRRDAWSPSSHHEYGVSDDDDCQPVAVMDSSSSGLGLHTRIHRWGWPPTYNLRSRQQRSASKDCRRIKLDSPTTVVHSEYDYNDPASKASITDCPPPSPSSDYFRLNLWVGEPPDGADCDDDVDSAGEQQKILELAESGDERRSPFNFSSRSTHIWHTQVNTAAVNRTAAVHIL